MVSGKNIQVLEITSMLNSLLSKAGAKFYKLRVVVQSLWITTCINTSNSICKDTACSHDVIILLF